MAVDLRQTHFRFGNDDGTEAAHTFKAAEDTNVNLMPDVNFLLRFTEQESGGTAAANTDAQFQYNRNGAGWNDITTASSVVRAVAVGAFTNGQACTQRLSGTGTFESSGAGCTEDGSSGGTANDIAASGNSETEAGLVILGVDVVRGDTIQFRFTSPDWAVTHTVTPQTTVLGALSLNCESGVFSENGTTANLLHSSTLGAESGSYSLAGTLVDLSHGHPITALSGLFSVTGTDATLTYTPSSDPVLVAESGAFLVTGASAGLLASHKLGAISGSYLIAETIRRVMSTGDPYQGQGGGGAIIVND